MRTPVTEDTEKYGVEEEVDSSKTAAEGKNTCPRCSAELRPQAVTGVLLCPKCGSKPFEREGSPR